MPIKGIFSVTQTNWMVKTRSLYLENKPLVRPKYTGTKHSKWPENGQNPKGGPLDEKNIFSTTFSDFIQIRLKRSETRCWFQKHIYQCTLWHWMSSYDITWHLMTADVIWWHQMSKMYWSTCFWNQHSISNHLSLFSTKSKNVVEKIFFSSKGPPFGFWPFSGHFKIFASRCHSLKIELEGWNFQRMSQICQIITVSICEANVQLLL